MCTRPQISGQVLLPFSNWLTHAGPSFMKFYQLAFAINYVCSKARIWNAN
jgi:hypothetical protein